MDQLIPGVAELVGPFHDCFRIEVFQTFQTFQAALAGWILCNGPHTIGDVWQATGLAAHRHHDTASAVFHSAAWGWDDPGIVLATLILTDLIPLAEAHPDRILWLAGASAYLNATTLQGWSKDLRAVGPLHWKVALSALPEPPAPGRKGADRARKGSGCRRPRR